MAATDLISGTELNSALQESADSTQDARKLSIIEQVSVEIENFLDRQLVTRGARTEDHTAFARMDELYLGQYPLIGTVTVKEDPDRARLGATASYGAATLLVANTDYEVLPNQDEPQPYARLRRLQGVYWSTERLAIRVAISAAGCGYADTAAVPKVIKGVCLEVCARVWRDRRNSEIGLTSRTDATGTITRQLPALLLEEDKRKLWPYRRLDFAPTWERAA